MEQPIVVTFDGQVLRPETPVDLEINKQYRVTLTPIATSDDASAWDVLDVLAGTVETAPDWAAEHDHYLYGTPKHQSEERA